MAVSGHIQEMALVEVIDHKEDSAGVLRPINYSVVSSLKITPSFGAIWYTDLDFGFPEIDGVITPFSNASGTFDETRYHRERAVSLSLTIVDDWFPDVGAEAWPQEWNSSSYWVRQLGRWVTPSGRYRLYWRHSGSDNATYWTDIRGVSMTNSIVKTSRDYREIQLNWVSASGKIYFFDESYNAADEPHPSAVKDGRTRYEVHYLDTGGETGITLPITFPLDFPVAAPGTGGINYPGTVENGFVARIYADLDVDTVDPRLTITAPDGTVSSIGFSGLTIPAGQFAEIDTNKMSCTMNGIIGEGLESYLVAPLQFPRLQPGFNKTEYTVAGTAPGPGSIIEILYFSAFLA
jgi:hypothetical protein